MAAERTYDVRLTGWEDLTKAKAISLDVVHESYTNLTVSDFEKLVDKDAVLVDVKSTLNREQFANNDIQVWRL